MKNLFLLPGYLSQTVGMAKDLYDEHRLVQEYFEEASNCLNINFVRLCFASSEHELAQPHNAYPAIFLVSTAIAALLKAEGIQPEAVAGFGIGYVSALHAAGAITLPDGLYVLSKYAQLLEQHGLDELISIISVTHMNITLLEDWVTQEQRNSFYINAYMSKTSAMVLAPAPYKSQLLEFIAAHHGAYEELSIYSGLYAPLAHALSDTMQTYGQKIDFNTPQVPVLSPLDGAQLTEKQEVRDTFFGMLQTSIRWDLIMKNVYIYDCFIHIGPGTLLNSISKQWYEQKHR